MQVDLKKNTILLTVAGSRAYNMHTETSDLDVKGVVIPPPPYLLGCGYNYEQTDSKATIHDAYYDGLSAANKAIADQHGFEGVSYGLTKFMKLAAAANPNILDVLFCRDEDVLICTPLGSDLRARRHLFISAKAKWTFSGYAHSQLKRIKGHRAWLLNPPKAQPTRKDFGLPETSLIPREQRNAAEAAVRSQLDTWDIDFGEMDGSEIERIRTEMRTYMLEVTEQLVDADAKYLAACRKIGLSDNLIEVMQKERAYDNAKRNWRSYQTWKTNRNPARAALEAKHGYDTKHGAHLVRLLLMGEEILTNGKVNVWRDDADEIKRTRNGEVGYDELVAWAEEKEEALNTIYRSGSYTIPKQPNMKSISALHESLVRSHYGIVV